MKKILVVEDVEDINNLVCGIMRKEGFEAVQAFDGDEAAKILEKDQEFCLIILDIIMPHQDGFDVIKFIEDKALNIPVLGMSGGGRTISGEVALKSIQSKVSNIMKKPFTKDALISAANKAMGEG